MLEARLLSPQIETGEFVLVNSSQQSSQLGGARAAPLACARARSRSRCAPNWLQSFHVLYGFAAMSARPPRLCLSLSPSLCECRDSAAAAAASVAVVIILNLERANNNFSSNSTNNDNSNSDNDNTNSGATK